VTVFLQVGKVMSTTNHDIDRLPMYLAWTMIPKDMRLLFVRLAFSTATGPMPPPGDESFHDYEWMDMPTFSRKKIMNMFRGAAAVKWEGLRDPNRARHTLSEQIEQRRAAERDAMVNNQSDDEWLNDYNKEAVA